MSIENTVHNLCNEFDKSTSCSDTFAYSTLSQSLTKKIDKNEKKSNGIYFTPPETVHNDINYLKPFMKNIKEVLEPSCGSCEYILALNKRHPNVNITGIEFNKTIYESIKSLENDKIKLFNSDFLNHEFNQTYDLIIGNPPYFVMEKKYVCDSYKKYFDGRPNIFILFIIKSLGLLNDNGILSFIVPNSFVNCLYYDKTRKYINENFIILNINDCNDNYIETKQDTIRIVLQKKKPITSNELHILNISEFTIFGTKEKIVTLKKLYSGSTTLNKVDFNVNVGTVVWNQCKSILTDDKEKTLLIYSSDITNNKLETKQYSNTSKKNYINKNGSKSPLLVINRGYGVGSYHFNYCLINENDNTEYLVENHLICIKHTKPISDEDLIRNYKKIIRSFEHEKTVEFIKIYFGNNAMNTTELSKILPIYDYN